MTLVDTASVLSSLPLSVTSPVRACHAALDTLVLPGTHTVAVAVSGGSDSLALALLTQAWAGPRGIKTMAVTVDHGLRPESAAEAEQVRAWLGRWGLDHTTLRWQPPQNLTSGVQARARAARYGLLELWCARQNITHLVVGHHGEDQHETVAMRWQRQSGRDGLVGLQPLQWRRGLRLLRPLLRTSPGALQDFLRALSQEWVVDPSNSNRLFARIRVRHCLAMETAQPLRRRLETLSASAGARREVCDARALHFLTDRNLFINPAGFATLDINVSALRRGDDALCRPMGLRALRKVLLAISGRDYAPREGDVQALLQRVIARQFVEGLVLTLGGCCLHFRSNVLRIERERRNLPPSQALLPGGMVWDRRFLLMPNVPDALLLQGGGVVVHAWETLARSGYVWPSDWPKIPASVRASWPILSQHETLFPPSLVGLASASLPAAPPASVRFETPLYTALRELLAFRQPV